MTKILERDIMVLACKRTGHHAIMDWICSGMPEPHFRLNNISSTGRAVTAQVRKGMSNVIAEVNRKNTFCLMYNVEQARLPKVAESKLYKRRSDLLGVKSKVRRRDTILVVRDAFNGLASAVKFGQIPDVSVMVPILKDHYKQALGLKSFLDCYVINFNLWFVSEAYRRKIAEDLDFHWIDCEAKHSKVANAGGGSSFDYKQFNGKAQKMRVLERYKKIGPHRKKCVDRMIDKELRKLSHALFGTGDEVGE